MSPVDEIFELFEKRGAEMYSGEPVTQLQHALQAAALAAREGADEPLIAAALLHDVGHLLAGGEEDRPAVDFRHEDVGAAWLRSHFPEAVWMPVRLHVPAKRYLCATDASYLGRLSAASVHSLRLQGGAMSAEEAREFEASPYCRSAVRLRRWDEEAKDPEAKVADLSSYRKMLGRLAGA